jgi:hypothetical protein
MGGGWSGSRPFDNRLAVLRVVVCARAAAGRQREREQHRQARRPNVRDPARLGGQAADHLAQ